MIRLLGPALLLAMCGAAPAYAQAAPGTAAATVDPERLALANEIIALAYPPERRQAIFMGTMDALMGQTRTAVADSSGGRMDAGAQSILDRFAGRARSVSEPLIAEAAPPLFSAMARGYARLFTRDELIHIRAFVATPAGAKYFQRSAELLNDPDVAEANTAYITRVLTALQPLQAELRQQLSDHFRKDAGH
ncbi:MAG: hypothetical protein ACJ8ER_03090 [Allosphingosinicella sp.]